MNKPHLVAFPVLVSIAFIGCDEKAPPPKTTTPPVKTEAAASKPAAPQSSTNAAPAMVSALGVSLPVPPGWTSVPPGNSMRLAEIQAPDPSGDAAKMCTLVLSTAGGDVQANIARWQGQVTDAGGKPVESAPKVRTVEGMTVTSVEMTGAYANMGDTAPHANWTMRGSVIETPSGLLFLKMTGPAEQMTTAGKMMEAMIAGMKKQ